MTERRYTEPEVADIFQRATETAAPERQRLPTGEGMTLAELQEIGREVGIAPELVASAAAAMDRGGQATGRSVLGLPIGVGRTVELGRQLSDDEWERLVVDLRETFDAKGKVSRDGALRQWTNGNLHAYIEPGDGGQRLRMRTYNGTARILMILGAGYVGFAGVLAAVLTATSGLTAARLPGVAILTALGISAFGLGAARLPGWAKRRRSQMESVVERLLAAANRPDDTR
ncbi:MAG TPA: hypothetical protein VIJ16_06190 [Gemmatimonadaceae bacterium]